MTKDEALRLAMAALVKTDAEPGSKAWERESEAITAIKEALAQPAQEPVAWMNPYGGLVHKRITGHERNNFTIPLYTTPPQRTWVAQPEQEPCCYGGIAHDCHAGQGCRIAERLKAAVWEKQK